MATDEEVTILELVDLCAQKLGIEHPRITFSGYRASDPERRMLNTEKLRRRTGWSPKIDLAQGIELCVRSMQNRG